MLGKISFEDFGNLLKEYSQVEDAVSYVLKDYLKLELINFKTLMQSIPYLRT